MGSVEPTQRTSPRPSDALSPDELADAWLALSEDERAEGFLLLPATEAESFFEGLDAREQASLLLSLPESARRVWIRLLAPDDAADVVQEAPEEQREQLLALLDVDTRREVRALLAYAEDVAGGLMSPRYARVRPGMTADEAIRYVRLQARAAIETIYYVYVVDRSQRLLGVASFRELFTARPDVRVRDVMHEELVTVPENMDQEEVSRLFSDHRLLALPVVDTEGRMKGVITVDDIVDVVREEDTEDVQKVGGSEALSGPYLGVRLREMIAKRAGWLTVLFIGEMFTATAMGYYEHEIAQAVVLALFLPLIISSGGNTGSQASTLIVRALALEDVRLTDWWRVLYRELASGAILGLTLGAIGFLRVVAWEQLFGAYGPHYLRIAATVSLSLIGVVLSGCVAGAMLPFLLRRLHLDPASASAPFVATLVDVGGVVIYFTVASTVLRGTLL